MLAEWHKPSDGDDRLATVHARLGPEGERAEALDDVELVTRTIIGRDQVQVQEEPVRTARDGQRKVNLRPNRNWSGSTSEFQE